MTLERSAGSPLVNRLRQVLFERLAPELADAGDWDLVDFADYFNCGDSAIFLGELEIGRHFGIRTRSVSTHLTYTPVALRADGPIVIQGGGNFGGLYPAHQELRLKLLRDFPTRRIIQMPQSVEFASTDYAEQLKRAIGQHPSFLLYVRDDRSYERATRELPCEVRLVPDAAFAIGGLHRAPPVEPVTVQMRTDDEKGHSSAPAEWSTFDWLDAGPGEARYEARRHWHRAQRLARRTRLRRLLGVEDVLARRFARLNVEHAVALLVRGNLLVTDRLHGHIMAELLSVPHVSINDRYGKIRAYWETWTPDTEIGVLVNTWDEAVDEVHRRKQLT